MAEVVEPIEKYALTHKEKAKSENPMLKIGIVGCDNTEGQDVARLVSSKGFDVVLISKSGENLDAAFDEMGRELDRMIDRWGMTSSEKRAIMSRIKGSSDYKDLSDCGLVIESIKPKSREGSIESRKEVMRNIELNTSTNTIIASNTSTLLISELSNELEHPERCISLHFLSPAVESKVIEVAKGLYTSDETYNAVCKFALSLGKSIISLSESPGMISTRLIVPLINEACDILMEGVASVSEVDLILKLGFGLPIGPFGMVDRIGVDKVIRWMDNLYREYGDIKYKASPVLKKMERSNHLGKKTGKGFYQYDEFGNKINEPDK